MSLLSCNRLCVLLTVRYRLVTMDQDERSLIGAIDQGTSSSRYCSRIHRSLTGDKVNSGIGLSYRPAASHVAWRAGRDL
jgi:hypothetical protein